MTKMQRVFGSASARLGKLATQCAQPSGGAHRSSGLQTEGKFEDVSGRGQTCPGDILFPASGH